MTNTTYTPEQQYVIERLREGLGIIPAHMHGAVERYVLHGMPPGSFLAALLSNDFMGAAGRADNENRKVLSNWAAFLYNDVPSGCKGSPEHFSAWVEQGGLLGGAA